jgi:hypothetical protein
MAGGEESQGRGRRISSLPTFGRGAASHHPPSIHHPSASPKGMEWTPPATAYGIDVPESPDVTPKGGVRHEVYDHRC